MPRGMKVTSEQIISMLHEAEVDLARGKTDAQVCKNFAIAEQTYYRWKNDYGGLRVGQGKDLKALERERSTLTAVG